MTASCERKKQVRNISSIISCAIIYFPSIDENLCCCAFRFAQVEVHHGKTFFLLLSFFSFCSFHYTIDNKRERRARTNVHLSICICALWSESDRTNNNYVAKFGKDGKIHKFSENQVQSWNQWIFGNRVDQQIRIKKVYNYWNEMSWCHIQFSSFVRIVFFFISPNTTEQQ